MPPKSAMNNSHATLSGLVSKYSPSGQESIAVDWLLDHMENLGFTETFQDAAGNAVGIMGNGRRQIVLLGHIDTVPGEIPVREEAGNLYGRGTVDAKGALASFVDAAAQAGERDGWQMVVIAAVEEERNSDGARYILDRYQPELLIAGEPSGWDRIALGYKGSARASVHLQRARSHSAGQEASPGDLVFALWEELRAFSDTFNRDRQGLFQQVVASIQEMQSGQDGFHAWAGLTIGARLPLDLPPDDWLNKLEEISKQFGATCTPLGFPIPAFKASKNTILVRAFLRAIRRQQGKPGFLVKTGTADLNITAPVWGCPAVVYGPGNSALDHTPDEHISLREYGQAVTVLREVLLSVTAKVS